MGMIKGKTMGAVKRQIVGGAESPAEGLKKYKMVERTVIKPTTEKTAQQFGRALDILKEAKVVRSSVKGPLTLLQQAKFNIAKAQVVEDLAKKKRGQELTKQERLKEEGVSGRGLLEKIEKEENTTKTAEKVLNEVKSAKDTSHQVSVFESGAPKEKPSVETPISTPPMEF